MLVTGEFPKSIDRWMKLLKALLAHMHAHCPNISLQHVSMLRVIALQAIDLALEDLDNDSATFTDSSLIIQLLRDNLIVSVNLAEQGF